MVRTWLTLLLATGWLLNLYSQGIEGEIRDLEGEPVPYAAICIKELTRGTTCNALGQFSLPLPAGTYTIFFRSLGYTEVTRNVEIGDRFIKLEIELPPASTLADVVDYLALPREKVRVIFVNGRAQPLDYRLVPGDEVGMFPPIGGGSVETITLDVWLYGPLARYGGEAARRAHAHLQPELPAGTRMRDLLARLALPTEERGITFINGDLSAMPDLQPDLDHILEDGDRVALFHLRSMWPAQYRDGAALAPGLARAMSEEGELFHHRSKRTR